MTTALVLSAGGMFAAWEAGVWKSLCRRFKPDMIVGASAGAWNGWAIAGGCSAGDLIREWMDSATARIGLFRAPALHQRARELFSHYQPRIPFGLTVVEVPRLRARLLRDSEITWQHLAATCTIPFGFPPVRIENRRYVDGGLLGALPLWAAQEMGATRAIAVNALTTLPFRMLHKVMWGPRASAALEVIRIEPSTGLGSLRDAVCWSRANVERWVEQGERDANRVASSITM
jgi:NTE family protein